MFEELRQTNQIQDGKEKSAFYIEVAKGSNACEQSMNEGFVVLKDSSIATSTTN